MPLKLTEHDGVLQLVALHNYLLQQVSIYLFNLQYFKNFKNLIFKNSILINLGFIKKKQLGRWIFQHTCKLCVCDTHCNVTCPATEDQVARVFALVWTIQCLVRWNAWFPISKNQKKKCTTNQNGPRCTPVRCTSACYLSDWLNRSDREQSWILISALFLCLAYVAPCLTLSRKHWNLINFWRASHKSAIIMCVCSSQLISSLSSTHLSHRLCMPSHRSPSHPSPRSPLKPALLIAQHHSSKSCSSSST